MSTEQVSAQKLEADATRPRSHTINSRGDDSAREHESYSLGAPTVDAQTTSPAITVPSRGKPTNVPAQSQWTPFQSAVGHTTPQQDQHEDQASRAQADISCAVGDCPNAGEQQRRVHGLNVFLCWTHSRRLTTNGTLDIDQPVKRNYRRPKHVTTCQVDDCNDKPRKSIASDDGRLFVCNSHYNRWNRTGSVHLFEHPMVTQSDISNGWGSATDANPADRLAKSSGAELIQDAEIEHDEGISGFPEAHSEQLGSTNAVSTDYLTTFSDDTELSDEACSIMFGGLIDEFTAALATDASYAAEIITRGKRLNRKTKADPAIDGFAL